MRNNSDICLFKSDTCLYKEGNIVDEQKNKKQKGGIDPAGADEHQKTENTALNRIRDSFVEKI